VSKKFPKTMPFDWDNHQRFDPTLLTPDRANPNDRASDKEPGDTVSPSRPTGAHGIGKEPVSPSRKNLGDIEKEHKEDER
jgi:hypothetical protein